MNKKGLADSGLQLSRIMIGTTMFGEILDEGDARAVLHAAWDRGLTTIDTADIYAGGGAEPMVGKLISGNRHRLTICTKVGYRVGDGPDQHRASAARRAAMTYDPALEENEGLSPGHIRRAVERSLKNLGTDYIDLYQVHRWDPAVPVEETLLALDALVKEGKVRAIGCSIFTAAQLRQAHAFSKKNKCARFETVQAPYSLLSREPEKELLPACKELDVGVIAFSALAGGALSGAHDAGVVPGTVMAQRQAYQEKYLNPTALDKLRRFAIIADNEKRRRTALAIGAVLAHPAVAAATIGVQRPAELDDLASALEDPIDAVTIETLKNLFS